MFLLRESVPNDLIKKVLNARDILLDGVGMSIHHDAVTGTCGQPVANDYAYRVHKALYETRNMVAEIAKYHLKEDTGTETPRMFACERNNGTYMDCPPGKMEDASGWIITIFNPSMQVRRIVKFKINHPNWVVLAWDN
jgi:uncharacterized protein YcgI (DUF1989 family)